MGGLAFSWPIQGFPPSPSAGGTVANAVEVAEVTQQVVLSYTPPVDSPLKVSVSLTIATATTTVTLSASWTDPNGGAQTYTWENASSLVVGVRFELPLILAAKAGDAVEVLVTVGTANQVFVTGSIERAV